MTSNDDAREAAMFAEYVPEEAADWVMTGWDACLAHLRATGQLCTVEERIVLEAMDGIPSGTLSALLALEAISFSASVRHALECEQARRRAKGEADAG